MPKKPNLQNIKEKIKNLESNVKLALGVIFFVFLWMLSGVFSNNSGYEKEIIKHKNKSIQALHLTSKPYTRRVIISATTEPFMLVNLAARIEGQIETITADKGDHVSKTELLLSIEDDGRSEAVKTAKLQLRQAKSLFDAAKNLNKQGYRADTSLDGRRAELALAEESLVNAENSLAYTKISSPIDGIVEDRLVEVGDYVKKGDPVYKLVSKAHYKIVAYISQKDRSNIIVGNLASATLVTGNKVSGKVSFIATNAHNITHTYKIEVDVLSDVQIPTGMSAKLNIPTKTISAHLVPYVAMVLNDDGQLGAIILKENNKAKFVAINPLDDNGNGFFLGGLPKDVLIVVKGQASLIDGEIVSPQIIKQAPVSKRIY